MSRAKHIRWGGVVSAIAGALFVPYALSKGYLTSLIVADGWRLLGLSTVATAQLFHVFEAVPLVFMAVGLVALDARAAARGAFAGIGLSVALAGIGLTILSHLGEHLLAPVTAPALTGGENLLLWAYYLSWLVLYVGAALYGLALVRTPDVPRWLPSLFVFALPSVLVVGLVVAALEVFTMAGTFRVVYGLTWVLVGRWLWAEPEGSLAPRRNGSDLVAGHGTDDR